LRIEAATAMAINSTTIVYSENSEKSAPWLRIEAATAMTRNSTTIFYSEKSAPWFIYCILRFA
jgi:hypothetical protein